MTMIDQSAIGLPAVQAPLHGANRDKAGSSGDDDKDQKSFGDLVSEAGKKVGAKHGTDDNAAAEPDDEKQTAAEDAKPLGADDIKQAGADTTRGGTVPSEGRIRLSTGFQQLLKNGSAGLAARAQEHAKADEKDLKSNKKEQAASRTDQAVGHNKASASPSEELSILLGVKREKDDASSEETADKPLTKAAGKHAEQTDDKNTPEPKTVQTDIAEQPMASATHAAGDREAPQRQTVMAHPNDVASRVAQDDKPAKSGDNADSVRVVSADGKGRPLDIQLPKTRTDDTLSQGAGKTDFVTVLDQRRYLGFSNDSNASTLTSAIKSDTSWAEAIRGASVSANKTGTEVNTLKLQMNPEHLGHMTASLRLKGEELSVDVRVETVEAYRQLSKDQDGILKALKDQGFQIDQVTVQLVPSAKADTAQDNGGQSGNGQNLREGQGDTGRQRDDGGRRAGNQNNWTGNEQASSYGDTGDRANDGDSGNLYL